MKTFRVLAVLLLVSCETPPPPPTPPTKETLLDLVEDQNTDKVRERFGLNEDVNTVNAQGQTALHVAAIKDLADIAAVLLARGADVDRQDVDGLSPLHLAVKNGSAHVIPILAQYGANLFSADKQGRTVVQTALQQNPDLLPSLVTKTNIGSRDTAGNTLLHLAAAQGLEGLADVLIQRGADQSVRNTAGLTALDEALQFPQSLPHAKVAWKLVRNGAPQPKDPTVSYFWFAAQANNANQPFESGQSALHYAASAGHTGVLKLLIGMGAKVDVQDLPGNTPLHRAVENGDLEAAGFLLDHGADVNARDFNSNSALHLALTSRNALETANFLLARGAVPNVKNNFGNTPLHMVVALNLPPQLVRALAAKGADVNARNKQGNSPLLDAVLEANQPLIGVLLELKANPFAGNNLDQSPLGESVKAGVENLSWLFTRANKDLRDDDGNTALHRTVQLGHYPEAVAYLLSIGANPNERNKKGQGAFHLAIAAKDLEVSQALWKASADLYLLDNAGQKPIALAFQAPEFAAAFFVGDALEARDVQRNTPLFYTAQLNNVPMAQLLLNKGASVRVQNAAGQTVLHEAVRLGNLPLASLLLKNGAPVNASDAQGNTPLHNLVLYDSMEMGELLLAAGADKEARNKDGRTVLHETVRRGLIKAGTWLLQKGANASTRDNQGRTPLFDAVLAPSPAFVQLLLQNGTAVNARDETGSTVLHLASSLPPAMVSQLLAAGADPFAENALGITPAVTALKGAPDIWKVFFSAKTVNTQNNKGSTALHLAAGSGVTAAAVQYLVSLGADLRIRDKDGKTAGDLATAAGRTDLVSLLTPK